MPHVSTVRSFFFVKCLTQTENVVSGNKGIPASVSVCERVRESVHILSKYSEKEGGERKKKEREREKERKREMLPEYAHWFHVYIAVSPNSLSSAGSIEIPHWKFFRSTRVRI